MHYFVGKNTTSAAASNIGFGMCVGMGSTYGMGCHALVPR
jgi:hypothetical protein